MNYVELLMNNPPNTKLDIAEGADVDIEYSVADIRDISKRDSAGSRTILLAGSKNNNYWLGNLYDINSDFTNFNLNKKTECKLTVNSETVLDGFFQLKNIRKVPSDDSQAPTILYEIVIYNNSVDLLTELGEKSITEIDLRRFNHQFNISNVMQSWYNTKEDGYTYPMYGTDQTLDTYELEWFRPSVFYWTLFDEMLKQANFGWRGSFKENKQFQREILSYASDGRPMISEEERVKRQFEVGRTTPLLTTLGTISGESTSGMSTPTKVNLNNKTDAGYYDNNNNFDISQTNWKVKENGKYKTIYDISIIPELFNNSGSTAELREYGFGPNYGQLRRGTKVFEVIAGVYVNGVLVPSSSSKQLVNWTSPTFGPAEDIKNGEVYEFPTVRLYSTSGELDLKINDIVELRTSFIMRNSYNGFSEDLIFRQTILPNITYFGNIPITSEIAQGDEIILSDFMSEKTKQKDLVKDLISRYNLYISVDPDNERMLVIDSRSDFYKGGISENWTDKKDNKSEDNLQFLSELQVKEMIFTYKNDGDDSNKSYTDGTGDIYGQYKHIFNNDFVLGEKKVESPFSPTPLIRTSFGAIVPHIDPVAPKINTRVLFYGGIKPTLGNHSWTLKYQDVVTGLPKTVNFNKYPYAGHFDDPIKPTLDLNFGVCKFYNYSDYTFLINNNMYNTYWADHMNQIEEGRMITSQFYLTESDIRKVKDSFNIKIFVDNAWFYINKIKSYKPLQNGLSSVELIKIVDGVKWDGQPFGGGGIGTGVVIGIVDKIISEKVPSKPIGKLDRIDKIDFGFANNVGVGSLVSGNFNEGGGNTKKLVESTQLQTGWILEWGFWNDGGHWIDTAKWEDITIDPISSTASGLTSSYKIVPNRQMIIGDNNRVNIDRGFVLGGDNNTIESENTSIINGSNNKVGPGSTNTTLIQANYMEVVESNRIYLGPHYSIESTTGDIYLGTSSTPAAVGGLQNLAEVLNNGNYSGYDIRMTSPTLIRSDLFNNYIDFNYNSGGMKINSDTAINITTPSLKSDHIELSNSSYVNRIESDSLTANRTIKVPNKSGTIALTSDNNLLNVTSVISTTSYTIQPLDDVLLYEDPSPGGIITLPPSLDNVGRVIRIKNENAHGITINVDDPITEKIDNGNTDLLLGVNEKVMLISRPQSGSIKGWVTF